MKVLSYDEVHGRIWLEVINSVGIRRSYFHNGQRHRNDGKAAIIFVSGIKMWYVNGELHREDGPAFVSPDEQNEWYLYGCQYSESSYNQLIKVNSNRTL